jgi:CubicO group peptidase (beta-lactamase class C family)
MQQRAIPLWSSAVDLTSSGKRQSGAPIMKTFGAVAASVAFSILTGLTACSSTPSAPFAGESKAALRPAKVERPATDVPWKTAVGNSFVVPAGWAVSTRGNGTILEAPEGGTYVAIFDLEVVTADDAIAMAWQSYKPDARWPLKSVTPVADREGWTDRKTYSYQTSPNERRDVEVDVRRANNIWTITISDLDQGVEQKRASQINLIFGKFLPKGYERESFANRKAHSLDAQRIAELNRFVRKAMELTGVPGVSVGLYQDGHVVFAGGFGVREMGNPSPPDGKTRYMVASNTKALVTLLLAQLVEEKRISWDSTVIDVFPSFKLGDAQTTRQVLVKHLICACTGMPRQDLEWLLNFRDLTPDKVITLLGTMQPTSGFGELFQYSNPMAAAAGYMGGQLVYPDMELGAAFDRAMQKQVFDPLGMSNTTMDFALAQRGNFATPHAPDVDGHMTLAEARANYSMVPMRPAGAVWSSVDDMLKYVAMELAEGKLPDGTRFIDRDVLLERRAPQVVVSTDVTYGMALTVDRVYGTPVVHHGGDMIGFHSDMIRLPEYGVGAVILTNGNPGWQIRTIFRRKLLEVLFDGKPEADAQIEAQSRTFYEEMAAERRLLTVPADTKAAEILAASYVNPALGTINVGHKGATVVFDLGVFVSDVGSRANPDGTTSFITTVPGMIGFEYVAGTSGNKRTLTLRDMQHEYVFLEN